MRLPPFDAPFLWLRSGPTAPGAATASDLARELPPIPSALPAVSQELVMNMFRDKEGMMPLMKAGLAMAKAWT